MDKHGPDEETFRLWRLLDHAVFMISRLRERELASCGLTPEQAHVLDILNTNGGSTTLNVIVEITARQHHSISTLVRRMVGQGLVTLVTRPDDRRKYDVRITEKGQELFNSIKRDSVIESFSCLTGSQKKELADGAEILLRKAYATMNKRYHPDMISGDQDPEQSRG